MCGIAGAFDLHGRREFPRSRLLAMSAAIVHRGPDDEHVHLEPGLALATRRLAIIDLSHGRQPLSNESGDVWVSYNGELFDYPELQDELRSRGHELRTRCDTEIWPHLYEDLGEQIFRRALGQFAVALWDRRSRTLYLARDRVGICPLYYAEADGWLLWGSEVRAILAAGLIQARADVRTIDHLFHFFCASTNRSFFDGIRLISPGTFLRAREGGWQLQRYWDLDFPDAGQERRWADPAEAATAFEARLRHAVHRRLRSDVPVVCYLSGGLDSTVVLGLCTEDRNRSIRSFTVGLDQAGPDERASSAESAEVLNSALTTVVFNRRDIVGLMPELIRAAEGPVIDTSCACLMRLAAVVHEHGFKVALTGEGADECMAGYIWFKTQKIGRTIVGRLLPPLPRMMHKAVLGWIGGGAAHRPPWEAMNGVRTVQQDLAELFAQTRETLYSAAMWERLRDWSAFAGLDLSNPRISRWHPLNQALYAGYKIMLPGLLMTAKGDRIAMNSSVETRYPFLDEDVVEFCASIDPNYKLRRYTGKWLLRQVAGRILPPRIASRPKTMFRAALSQTFLQPQRPAWVDQLLAPESLAATGYFDPAGVEKVRRALSGRAWPSPGRQFFDMGLTGVISTQLWHHTYCGGGLCELPTWTAPRV
jgi:asparagine synthase (glutamine-hydrolysing)